MALLPILEYPDPRLKKVATPVAAVTADIQKLVRDMAETMYAAPGVGLAATQVNIHKRVIVIDISETRDDLKVFINPEIVAREGELETEEGCLSVPGYYDKVTAIAEAWHTIPLCLTQPDRPKCRGMRPVASPVKAVAEGYGIAIAQAAALKTAEARSPLFKVPLDVLVVAAYGLLLPQSVLD